jgi:hypothetical protein
VAKAGEPFCSSWHFWGMNTAMHTTMSWWLKPFWFGFTLGLECVPPPSSPYFSALNWVDQAQILGVSETPGATEERQREEILARNPRCDTVYVWLVNTWVISTWGRGILFYNQWLQYSLLFVQGFL